MIAKTTVFRGSTFGYFGLRDKLDALRKAVLRFFFPPEKQLKAKMSVLQEFRGALENLSREKDKLTAIVNLYQVVSPWDDNRIVWDLIDAFESVKAPGQYDKLLGALYRLQEHIVLAGRDGYLNQTNVGEEIKEKKIYLDGGKLRLAHHSVEHWRLVDVKLRGFVQDQANEFIEEHVPPIISAIKLLDELTR
jgi:hypothetical protein